MGGLGEKAPDRRAWPPRRQHPRARLGVEVLLIPGGGSGKCSPGDRFVSNHFPSVFKGTTHLGVEFGYTCGGRSGKSCLGQNREGARTNLGGFESEKLPSSDDVMRRRSHQVQVYVDTISPRLRRAGARTPGQHLDDHDARLLAAGLGEAQERRTQPQRRTNIPDLLKDTLCAAGRNLASALAQTRAQHRPVEPCGCSIRGRCVVLM